MGHTSLLVVGAGPYGVASAARAQARGIDTVVFGRPMGFWTDNMPEAMNLRSGTDWHLDALGIHTFEAYLEEADIPTAEIDPIPIQTFLEYAAWFQRSKGVDPRPDLVSLLTYDGRRFEAVLESGARVTADAVVAAPGVRHFRQYPAWASRVPAHLAAHTCGCALPG